MTSVLARLGRPDTSKVLIRERLFTQLDKACERPVVWITAPAGAGKTTLVASYIHSKGCRELWYRMSSADTDMASFFNLIGQAARSLGRNRKKLPSFTPEYQLGITEFTRHYFQQIFERLGPSGLLVLDNFQDADTVLCDALAAIFEDTPSGVNTIVISRNEPPGSFARLIADQKLSLINWDTVRFTEAEMLSIAQQHHSESSITLPHLQRLNEHLDGWVTGLILLLEQGEEPFKFEPGQGAGNHEYLFDYFLTEVFQQLDTDQQEFLLQTALLPTMTASSCKRLTDNRSCRKILSELARRQYFTVRHGTVNPIYEYHPVFRRFLLEQASQQFDAQTYQQLRSRAGVLLADAGDIDAASQLLIQSESWPALTALILKHAKKQIELGCNHKLGRWLDAMPIAVITQQPWLLYWQGMSQLQYNNFSSRSLFEKAWYRFRELDDALGLYMSWCGIADSYTFSHETFAGADDWIDQLDWLQQRFPKAPTMEARGHLVFSAGQLIFWVRPNHPSLVRWMAKMETIYRYVPSKFLIVMSSVQLSIYYGQLGETSRLRSISKRIEKLTATVSDNKLLQALLLMTSFANDWMSARFELNYDFIDSSRKKLDDEGVKVFSGLMLAHALYHAACKHDLPRMKQLLDSYGESVNCESLLDKGHYQLHLCYYDILCGEYERAIQHGKVAVDLVDQACAPLPIWVSHGMLSYAYIETGQYQLAETHLDHVRDAVDRMCGCAGNWVYHMIASYLAFNQNRHTDMLEHLERCFSIGREKDMKASAIWPPVMVSTLCGLALEHNIEKAYACDLIRRYRLTPSHSRYAGEHWPWTVRIYTLGRFSLLLDDQAVDTDSRPFDLLKVILALGGRDVPVDNVIDILWPEAEGDQARANFKTTLHRLRKLLGKLEILSLCNQKLSLNEKYVWVDAWTINRQLESIDKSFDTLDAEQMRMLLSQLMHTYRGRFLASEMGAWAIVLREKLHNRVLRLGSNLADALEQNNCAASEQYYQQLLEIDPAAEKLYQGLIRCYLSQGRYAEAQASYNKCIEILQAVMGVSPSKETLALIDH
jgi:DNA-binding SARP family transcriptional activator